MLIEKKKYELEHRCAAAEPRIKLAADACEGSASLFCTADQ